MRNHHLVFCCGCPVSHSQQCTGLVSSHLRRHFPSSILSLFFPVASREGVKWYLAVVCVSLTITDVSHLFMCVLAVCVILFGEMFIQVLCPFFTRYLVFCCWIVGAPYVFWMLTPLSAHDLQVFSPILWLPFRPIESVLWCINDFVFNVVSLSVFLLCQPPFRLQPHGSLCSAALSFTLSELVSSWRPRALRTACAL